MNRRHFTFAGLAFALAACLPATAIAAEPFEMFGVNVKTATRAELRQALRKAGARPIRENDDYFSDLYEGQPLLKCARRLQMIYIGSKFASATYTFSGRSTEQYLELHLMLEQKFGKPSGVNGDPQKDAVAGWILPDMDVSVMRQEFADPGLAMTFTYRPNYELYQREVAEIEEEQRKAGSGRSH